LLVPSKLTTTLEPASTLTVQINCGFAPFRGRLTTPFIRLPLRQLRAASTAAVDQPRVWLAVAYSPACIALPLRTTIRWCCIGLGDHLTRPQGHGPVSRVCAPRSPTRRTADHNDRQRTRLSDHGLPVTRHAAASPALLPAVIAHSPSTDASATGVARGYPRGTLSGALRLVAGGRRSVVGLQPA